MEESAIQLMPAERVSRGQRVAIMNLAYADYRVPVHVNQDQMALMDACFDISLAHSVVARTRWESVGMALLARRGERAWVSGVGVVPAWRQRGIGRAMMVWLGEQATQMGVNQVLLEVISENAVARRLYASLGYREARELLTWQRPLGSDPLPIPKELLAHASPLGLLDYFDAWHDQPASWQREASSLHKMVGRLKGYRLDQDGEPSAYCIVGGADDALSLVDVGVKPGPGFLTAGRVLIQALSAMYWGAMMSIMNVPADDALNRILAALGFRVTLRQIEMVLEI